MARFKSLQRSVSLWFLKVQEEHPQSMRSAETVLQGRKGAEAILSGEDDRLLVVVGPCSVHDVKAALEYGQ